MPRPPIDSFCVRHISYVPVLEWGRQDVAAHNISDVNRDDTIDLQDPGSKGMRRMLLLDPGSSAGVTIKARMSGSSSVWERTRYPAYEKEDVETRPSRNSSKPH